MPTTTFPITKTRTGIRNLAAANGWSAFVNADGSQDTFVRDGVRVRVGYTERSWFDAPAGRFYTASISGADLTVDEPSAGNLKDVRAWLSK